jgi:hypothetical protein
VKRHGNFKHGEGASSPLYQIWGSMRDRCNNPGNPNYDRYGGRGIRVCKRWDDYVNFKKDMGPTRPEGMTLDRIDNNGPYSPANCRWASRKEQAHNNSRNRLIWWKDKKRTVASVADELGVSRDRAYYRLKMGWPLDKVFSRETWLQGLNTVPWMGRR